MPIGLFDSFGYIPGDNYKTCDEAALAALNQALLKQSIDEDMEYSGMIYQKTDGKTYSYTSPVKGGKDEHGKYCLPPSKLPPLKKGEKLAAGYHTHGDSSDAAPGDTFCYNCDFSRADKKLSDEGEFPSYLGTPEREVLKYSPDPQKQGKGSVERLSSPYRDAPAVLVPGREMNENAQPAPQK